MRNLILQLIVFAALLSPQSLRCQPTAVSPPADDERFRREVEAIQKAAHAHGDSGPAYLAELEKGFRRLQKEFPARQQIYEELLFVADRGRGESAQALARQILDWPASEVVQAKARGVLRKKDALGKPYLLKRKATDGRDIDLDKLKGKVVLLDFWATWCPPCRKGLPELKQLYARLQPRGFELIGLSFDDDLDTLAKFVAKEKMPWPQYCEGEGWNSPFGKEFGITSLPAMWLIDKQGRLRDVEAHENLAAKIEKLLAEP